MSVHRVIFRLDFDHSFKMVDAPGYMMHALSEQFRTPKTVKFFSAIGHDSLMHKVSGTFRDENLSVNLTVEINSISSIISFVNGVTIDRLISEQNYETCMKLAADIYDHFDIKRLNRFGIRLFYFSTVFKSRSRSTEVFRGLWNSDLMNMSLENLGHMNDIAIVLNGENDDKVGYRCATGPYLDGEAAKYVEPEIAEKINQKNDYDFVADIDFFEHNFEIKSADLSRWSNYKCQRANTYITKLEKQLVSR